MAFLKNILYFSYLFSPVILSVCLSLAYLLKEPAFSQGIFFALLFSNILALIISPFIMFFLLVVGAYSIFVIFKI